MLFISYYSLNLSFIVFLPPYILTMKPYLRIYTTSKTLRLSLSSTRSVSAASTRKRQDISLAVTVIFRNHKWLAAGAPASVMTYSGVAAVYMILLFVTNNRFNLPEAKTRCEQLPLPGVNNTFLACAGVNDPDIGVAVSIESVVILGALPIAALSRTCRI